MTSGIKNILNSVFIMYFVSILSLNSTYINYANIFRSNELNNVSDKILLAEIPKSNIYLYALDSQKDIEENGEYRKIVLEVDGKKKNFSWHVDIGESFKAKLILSDINNDGIEELFVIITTASGTGVNTQQVSLFNIKKISEIEVLDPLKAISKNIKTKLNKKDGNIDFKIDIKGNTSEIVLKESSSSLWFDNAYFGNYINYNVIDNKLIAEVGVQLSATLYVGVIRVEYIFKNNVLEPNNIVFEKFNN